MLTIQIDSGRRMMQISTATPSAQAPYVYVVEGRDPKTFMSEPFIDFIFLDGPCRSLEELLRLVEDVSAKRMTINRVNTWSHVDAIETKVVEELWDHFVKVPQPA